MSRTRLANHGDWESATVRIALIGDSTLDNVIWIQDEPSIAELLATNVPCAVKNLAADGFNSTDALNGSRTVISVGLREKIGDSVPFDSDGTFRPLTQLVSLEPPPTHVVLSIGGNDVREILGDISQLPQIIHTFNSNYPAILERCLSVTKNVIIMLQYRPSYYMDGGGYGVYHAIGRMPGPGDAVAKLNGLMQQIYVPVLDAARRHGLPIIDLPRTFDIYQDDLYEHQIEPSARGGQIITALAAHIAASHGPEKPSTFYMYSSCKPGIGEVVEEPNGDGPWIIPHDPSSIPGASGAPDEHQEKVKALVGMGFGRDVADGVLKQYDGDLQAAVMHLLDKQ